MLLLEYLYEFVINQPNIAAKKSEIIESIKLIESRFITPFGTTFAKSKLVLQSKKKYAIFFKRETFIITFT